jgi:hypothetical protein
LIYGLYILGNDISILKEVQGLNLGKNLHKTGEKAAIWKWSIDISEKKPYSEGE